MSSMVSSSGRTGREFAQYARYRGLYSRVARRLGVDRSYVSRVARGQRRSPRVQEALRAEVERIRKL